MIGQLADDPEEETSDPEWRKSRTWLRRGGVELPRGSSTEDPDMSRTQRQSVLQKRSAQWGSPQGERRSALGQRASDPQHDSVGQRLAANRALSFVGRAAESSIFRSALTGALSVLYVHGPGGIGKSRLLWHWADDAREADRVVVRVDGATVGSPRRLAGQVTGMPPDGRGVLLVDDVERCPGLQDWLVRHLVPRLPVGTLVVLAGREPPDPAWRADPVWEGVLGVVALGELSEREAVALLVARGVPERMREAVLSFAGGHPLAICLAADAVRNGPLRSGPLRKEPARDEPWTPPPEVIATLLARLVGQVPSAAHREALQVCAHTRTTDEGLLRAVLTEVPEADATRLFTWLRGQPFVQSTSSGLVPYQVARDVVMADLRWRDPEGYHALHQRLRAHLMERVRAATGSATLPAALNLGYLHRHSRVPAEFLTWRGEDLQDRYTPRDRPALLRLAAQAEGEHAAAIVDFWLERRPEAFYVHRRGDGEPVAFMAWLRLAEPNDDENAADPVVAAAWAHSQAVAPVRAGEHLAIARFMVHPAAHQRPSPTMYTMLMRVLAGVIQQERLAWSYLLWADPGFWEPLMTHADHHLAAEPRLADGTQALFAHDWRAVPLKSWLELLGSSEPAARRPAALANKLVVLSRPDFDQAVRGALRAWHRPRELAGNPLMSTKAIIRRVGDADQVESLRRILSEAVDTLGQDPRDTKLHRVLTTTFFRRVPTQEAAAERLGIPFSTYRRHLARGLRHVCDLLWEGEVHGSAALGAPAFEAAGSQRGGHPIEVDRQNDDGEPALEP